MSTSHTATPAPPLSRPPHASIAADVQPVDLERLRDMVNDDPALLRALVHVYQAEAEELLGGLRAAIRMGATREAERLAHKLGGSSAMCGMVGIVPPLRELELSGKAGRWPENEQLLLEADRQQERICAYLAATLCKN